MESKLSNVIARSAGKNQVLQEKNAEVDILGKTYLYCAPVYDIFANVNFN